MKSLARPLVWFLLAIVWTATLEIRDIAHPDEGRYSEISREMVASGDWVTPRLNDLKYFEKPPLQYWATALSFSAFGVSDLSARLWVGLCGFLTVVLLWHTARRLWNTEIADYAAMAAASTVYITGLSHVVTLDMGVSFFLTAALCGFLLAHHDSATDAENRGYMMVTWAAMAGAALSKGLIGVVIPGAVLVLYSLICRHWSLWRRMHWVPGLLLFFALAAPWHVLVAHRNPEWAHFYFIHEHFERFLTTEHHREGAWYYFIPLLLVGLLPWLSWLPAALRHGAGAETGRFQTRRFLLVWCGFIFAFFSLSGSKLPGYILPVFPALLLLLAPALALTSPAQLRRHAGFVGGFWLLVAIAALVLLQRGLGDERTPREYEHAMLSWALAGSLLCAICGAVAFYLAGKGQQQKAVLMIAVSGLCFLVFGMYGYQAYSPLRTWRQTAELVRPHLLPDMPIYAIGYDQSMPYYLGRTVTLVVFQDEFALGEQQEPEKFVPTLEEFAARWRKDTHALAVMEPLIYKNLVQPMGLPMRVIIEDPRRVIVEKP